MKGSTQASRKKPSVWQPAVAASAEYQDPREVEVPHAAEDIPPLANENFPTHQQPLSSSSLAPQDLLATRGRACY